MGRYPVLHLVHVSLDVAFPIDDHGVLGLIVVGTRFTQMRWLRMVVGRSGPVCQCKQLPDIMRHQKGSLFGDMCQESRVVFGLFLGIDLLFDLTLFVSLSVRPSSIALFIDVAIPGGELMQMSYMRGL